MTEGRSFNFSFPLGKMMLMSASSRILVSDVCDKAWSTMPGTQYTQYNEY